MRRTQLWMAALGIVLALGSNGCAGQGGSAEKPGGEGGRGSDGSAGGSPRGGSPRGGSPGGGGRPGDGRPGGGAPGSGWSGARGGEEAAAAVPVEVTPVERRTISSFIETHGTLEAENEVDLVARTSGPIVVLETEQGMRVKQGQLLARLDQAEHRAQLEIARVQLNEARLAWDRTQTLYDNNLVSREQYDQDLARLESAQAQFEGGKILLDYTEITAPFAGLIVRRYVKLAQHVSPNDRLFRISDFDPLLCPIQVPEREIPRLAVGQRAFLTVEAWPEERFDASVLRLSPVVDAASGTVEVTLEVRARERLRPGMFASVFLETETRDGALVIPRTALALDTVGDTVYVASGEVAARRDVDLGVREGDFVEVLRGLDEGEPVVTVGQDSLSDGTPIQVLGTAGDAADDTPALATQAQSGPADGGSAGGLPGAPPGGMGRDRPDFSSRTPEQPEMVRERLRARGLSDEEIEARLKRMREAGGSTP